jgi:REG-2-like HAD superfamily hydrolase
MLNHVRAISLDAMGTLIELRVNAQHTYYEILKKLGHPAEKIAPLLMDPGRFRRYWQEAEARLPARFLAEHRDRFHNYPDTPYAFWGLIFEAMFRDLGLDKEELLMALETAYQHFTDADLWRVEPTFPELAAFCSQRDIQLYITSNWDRRLPVILERLDVACFFAEIITSAQVGYEKPSKKIFAHLVAAAGCSPAEILHVGDSPMADIWGARQSGLRPVLFGRLHAADAPDCPVVETLYRLIDYGFLPSQE